MTPLLIQTEDGQPSGDRPITNVKIKPMPGICHALMFTT